MSGSLYRPNQPTTLQELFAQAGLQGDNPGAVAPPQAPLAQSAGQVDSRLLELLMKPQDQGPAPQVEQLSTWDKVRATLADSLGSAFQAYGAVLGGGSPPPLSNNYGRFIARQDQQKADLAEWQKKLGESQREAKLLGAKYIMGERDKAQTLAEEKAALTEERVYKEKVARDATTQRGVEEANRRDWELGKIEQNKRWDLDQQKAQFAHQEGMQKLENASKSGDKDAQKILDQFSAGARITTGFRNGLPADPKSGSPPVPPLAERLSSGEKPEDIRREFEDEMTMEGIFGHARDLTRDFFNEKMIRTYRAVQQELDKPQPPPPAGPFQGGINAWDAAVQGALPKIGP